MSASIRSQHIFEHPSSINRNARELRNGHKGIVAWLTGLSGSGKSTIAIAIEKKLFLDGFNVVLLDGDNLRLTLNSDLTFSVADRNENIRRLGEVANLFLNQGAIVIVAAISPIRSARERIKSRYSENEFVEIYCKCPIEICHERDAKGLYAKASIGELKEFTGVSSPYEEPLQPALILETGIESIGDSVSRVMQLIFSKVLI